jgi:hypothetical protein
MHFKFFYKTDLIDPIDPIDLIGPIDSSLRFGIGIVLMALNYL